MHRTTALSAVCACLLMLVSGCSQQPSGEVVIYSAVDQEFAAPILSAFTRSVGKQVQPQAVFASAATGDLADRLIAREGEAAEQALAVDLFWDDTVLDTIRLQRAGLLAPHQWNVPADWPAVAADQSWCGFAARARVLIVNENELADAAERPTSLLDLADPRWRGRCGIAAPLSGTMATHAAVLYQQWGPERFEAFFRQVADNAEVMPSNRQIAQAVATGRLAWGLTDSDAAIIEVDDRMPVVIVFPDQQPSQPGTLRIPNTIGILKTAPNTAAARALADFLVSPETEDRLAMGDSAQIPLFRTATHAPRVLPPAGVRWTDANFEAAADTWDDAAEVLRGIFEQATSP